MYNKLFGKILDSSIWLESLSTRIVWLTFIAVMDEHGFVQFAAVGNVANRANVTIEQATSALEILESPDPESGDKDHEGRRIERVPGGWLVLNAEKHRAMVTRSIVQEQTRERVRRHRERKRTCNASVTPSESESESESESDLQISSSTDVDAPFEAFWKNYPRKVGKADARKVWRKLKPTAELQEKILATVTRQRIEPQWMKDGGTFVPHPATWLRQGRWDDEPMSAASTNQETRRGTSPRNPNAVPAIPGKYAHR